MDRSGEMFAIWTGVGMAAIGAGIYGGWSGNGIGPLFGVIMVAALLATFLVYSEQLLKVYQAMRAEEAKAKREPADRIALLREVLDEDEWLAFKDALKRQALAEVGADDGELPLAARVEALESAREHYG